MLFISSQIKVKVKGKVVPVL